VIAGILNRQGRTTVYGHRFEAGRVGSLRRHWNIPCFEPSAAHAEGEPLTIKKAAAVLAVAPSTLHRLLNAGIIPGEQLTPGAPYSPILLLMPFGFQIALDTLPSGTRATGTRSALAVAGFHLRARLGFSIPPCFPGQRGITPRFRIRRSSSERRGDFNPLTHVLPSTHYVPFG
jgi:hypothetical protein